MDDIKLERLQLEHWRNGFITSFNRHDIVNYDGEIRDFWERQFAALGGNARIVDLGTGNGAVALLAAEYSERQDKRFRIDALDKAPIDPQGDISVHHRSRKWLEHIRFQGRTPNESTGLDSECADLVTSQYGFEYGDLIASANEVMRILKPGGRIALITHHADSVTAIQVRESLDQLRLFDTEQLLPRAHRVVESMAWGGSWFERRITKYDSRTVALRRELNQAISRVLQQGERFKEPHGIRAMEHGLENVFKPKLSPAMRRTILRELQEGCDSDRLGVKRLIAVALDSKEFCGLVEHLRSAGLIVCESFPLVISRPAFRSDPQHVLGLAEELPSRLVYYCRLIRRKRLMSSREMGIYKSLANMQEPYPGQDGDALMGWALVGRKAESVSPEAKQDYAESEP